MEFRTSVDMPDYTLQLGYNDKIVTMGSCFADEMYKKMKAVKLDCIANPYGILYNPISISIALNRILHRELVREDELVQHNGLWFSWDHHGCFSDRDRSKAIQNMNEDIEKGYEYLQGASCLIITWGSAFVYELKGESRIVGNCHKLPAATFAKRLLSTDEIKDAFVETFQRIQEINASIRILMTVSPVRHLSEGLIQNNRSKAVLISAIHEIVESFDPVEYFPAYEILMDDLRDYRFYGKDLVHPSEEAVNYIWELFQSSLMKAETISLSKKIMKIQKSLSHKPFHPELEEHQRFLKRTYQNMIEMQQRGIDFSREIAELLSRMGS